MHSSLLVIAESGLVQAAIAPFHSCTPRIPKTSKNIMIISMTFKRLGMDKSNELTTVLIPKIRKMNYRRLPIVLTFIFANDSQRPQCSESSKTSDKGNIKAINNLKDPSEKREEDDDEIEHVPTVLQVRLFSNTESKNYYFYQAFGNENN